MPIYPRRFFEKKGYLVYYDKLPIANFKMSTYAYLDDKSVDFGIFFLLIFRIVEKKRGLGRELQE